MPDTNDKAHNPHAISWIPDPTDPTRSFGSTADLEFRRTHDPLLDQVVLHSRPLGTKSWILAGTIRY